MDKNIQPVKRQWSLAFLLSFFALPLITLLCICAYGFVVWFGQLLFWGPPA